MSVSKDVDLLKIQIVSEHYHAIFTNRSSLIFGALIGFLVLFYTLLYNETFSPDVFWLIYGSFSCACILFIWKINNDHQRDLTKISDMIEKVKQGEELPPLKEIDIRKETKNEKEEKQSTTRAESPQSNSMNEKSHAQRFDEVFRIILIIEALFFNLVLDQSSFENQVLFIILFSATLLLWIIGHLLGGKSEYTIKIESLFTSIVLILGLLVTSIPSLYTEILFGVPWVLWFVSPFNSLIAFICCWFLVYYLRDSIDTKMSKIYLLALLIGYMLVTWIALSSNFQIG